MAAQATPSLLARIRWSSRSLGLLLRIGAEHPSLLWRLFTDNLRYLLVKLRFLPGAAKHVAEVRSAFEANAERGRFQEIWFDATDANIILWSVTFSKVFERNDKVQILEIGSWEGRSTLFLLTYFTQGHLTAVDTWAGSAEYEYNATANVRDLESRFDGNVAVFKDRVTKRKGSSLHVLPQLLDEDQKFDVIYVDGSHVADDVLRDSIAAWDMLKQAGILIFDDFLWMCYPRFRANPGWAINTFLKYRAGEYKVLNANYQLILQKTVTFDDHPITDFLSV
ncbi:class I SAM-dependent methyltransferase [Mycolicibacterium sp. GF69]|nr:class I SAM-dependent methyltransferase [Mycolicibacterium sp. GF69]